jgi:non-heme chloroperoxidase
MNQASPPVNTYRQITHPDDAYLEVISRFPDHPTGKPPLLFVHGSFISAWCWEVHFLPFFAQQGYPCYALSLRGHGGSYGHDRLHWHGLDDYVDDLERAVQGLDCPPVLIGHSMGGLIVQKYLQRAAEQAISLPGVALMASVPPQGLTPMMWWVGMTRPWLLAEISWVQAGMAQFSNHPQVCKALFSDALPESLAREYLNRTQAESQRALLEMSAWQPISLSPAATPPMLVLGAERDALVPDFAVQATAEAYGVTAELIPEMAHIMMLEPEWKRVAERVLGWLNTTC